MADLMKANLRRANLRNADFWMADMKDTILQGTDLQGANLSDVTNLTQKQVDSAITSDSTPHKFRQLSRRRNRLALFATFDDATSDAS